MPLRLAGRLPGPGSNNENVAGRDVMRGQSVPQAWSGSVSK